MAGTPANYSGLHLAYHSWMLHGDTTYDVADETGTFTIDTTDGVAGITEGLLSSALGGSTPYGSTTPFNPNSPIEPIRDVVDKGLAFLDDLESLGDVDDQFTSYLADVDTGVDGVYDSTKIDAMVTAFSGRRLTAMQSQQADIDALFGKLGAVETSARLFALLGLELEHARAVDDFDASLYLEMEKQKFSVKTQASLELVKLRQSLSQVQGQLLGMMAQVSQIDMEAKRQYVEDDLRLRLEDAVWDFKIYGFAGQALSAISGAAVIPASPNKTLEALSTGASIVGTLISAGAALGLKI